MFKKTDESRATRATNSLSDWLFDFSGRAVRQADQPAVSGSEATLTWAELEMAVAMLAGRLRGSGVEPGMPVAVCLERTPHCLVAFLAVLRVGGTWFPIDPEYPPARIAAMLDSTPAGAAITSPPMLKHLPNIACPVLFAGEDTHHDVNDSPGEIPEIGDDRPAYVMYTSGTTGVPNAVVVTRSALASYVRALGESLKIARNDVCLHTASFSFSASIRQLVAPLTAGAELVIAAEEERHDPFLLLQLMKDRNVTVWDTVPSVWKIVFGALVKAASPRENNLLPDTLRLILLTGEPLAWALVSAWRQHVGNAVQIINLYSQTEAVGTISRFYIPMGDLPRSGYVPLGVPLNDVTLMLLDEDLNPVMPGSEGEIWVTGDRLAVDPDNPHQRTLRTGDFARLDPDGSLIPTGRHDHRVKVRGFRVELMEIENALISDPAIEQAVVLAEESTRLIAYVVPAERAQPIPASVQARMRERLPSHAVPSEVIVLESIPLTVHGKLDRAALISLRSARPEFPHEEVVAANETEQKLLEIWEKSLDYRGATQADDFFERGGDSLTAVSLFLEIEDQFGIRLPPSTLLTAGTVGSLAKVIQGTARVYHAPSVTELNEGGNLPPLFLVHAIWEHMPHLRELVKLLDPNLPVYALEPFRNEEIGSRELDVELLVKRYAREIRNSHPEGPFFLGGWSIGGFMAFSVAVALAARGDSPAGLLLIDAMSPSVRPLIRRKKVRGLARTKKRLQDLLERQLRYLRPNPSEQWRRVVWKIRGVQRRLARALGDQDIRKQRARLLTEVRQLADQYQPPPYQGSAVLFRSEQPSVDPDQDRDLGWSQHIHGHLEIVPVSGNHITLMIEPRNVKLLASRISEVVNRDLARPSDQAEYRTAGEQSVMDQFFEESQKLCGQEYTERLPWTNTITRDSIRHFADAICDDNPLWSRASPTVNQPHDRLLAPPCILIAARYPVLHGAPLDVPLISLLKDIEYSWDRRICEGEDVGSSTRQGKVQDLVDPSGNRKIYIDANTTYWNSRNEVLGRARATVVRMLSQGRFQLDDWSIYRYSPEELQQITDAIQSEIRTGRRELPEEEFSPGSRLPSIVRGPLTIGDMVCWHSGVGPSYRPGPLGFKDTLQNPQFRVRNPITGWPIKYMLQHEDVNLAHQRGMPAPFDNGVMRFAWVSPLITNWMGDSGFLTRLHVQIHLPVFYGDTCWYSGEVTERNKEGDSWRVTIGLRGTNQHGGVTTTGSAEVLLPR
jgi:amino acid adenylation domain-containing protein